MANSVDVILTFLAGGAVGWLFAIWAEHTKHKIPSEHAVWPDHEKLLAERDYFADVARQRGELLDRYERKAGAPR